MAEKNGSWKEGYIALIDILGFSDGIKKDNLQLFFQKYDKSVQDTILKIKDPDLEYIVFSDTIILFTKKTNQKAFINISSASSLLFSSLLAINLPVRGCISYGKFHVKRTSNGVIIAGKPIIDAFNYEKKQNWIGIMISPTVYEKMPSLLTSGKISKQMIIRKCKQIPLHEDVKYKYDGYAIIPSIQYPLTKDKLWLDLIRIQKILKEKKAFAPNIGAQIKFENTLDWLNTCYHEIFGSGGPDSPILSSEIQVNHAEIENDLWNIPITIINSSKIDAENIEVFTEILNPNCCETVKFTGCRDVSHVNPGKTIFAFDFARPLLHGSRMTMGNLNVKMKGNKRALDILIYIKAKNMKEHRIESRLNITTKGVIQTRHRDWYLWTY